MADPALLFLYGNDEFAIARRLNALQQRSDPGGMNTTRLELRSCSEEELNQATHSMPFLSARRLVFLADPSAGRTTPAGREKLISFLRTVPPTTRVVLHEAVEPKEERGHWLLQHAGRGELQTERCMLPRTWEMPAWIVKEAQALGGEIEERAAGRLAEMVGDNTRQAEQELVKLLTYVASGRPICMADVEAVSVSTAATSLFAMLDALARGNGKEAQALLHRLLEQEDAFSVWGMIIRQFRLLLQARELLEAHASLQEAQHSIHEAPYSVEKAYQQAGRFSLPALERIHHRLLEMDEAAKTNQVPIDLALDIFIVELTRQGG
jgi:DNA polymerase-3 subunit delta